MTLQFVCSTGPHRPEDMTCYLAISCLLAVTGSTLANEPLEVALQKTLDQWTYPRYAYNYAVNDPHTGDNKAQWEQRNGDAVKGSYSLVEPDGSIRVVDYAADDHTGFNAVVKRLGPNLHPAPPAPLTAWPAVLSTPLLRPPALYAPASYPRGLYAPVSYNAALPAWKGTPGWRPMLTKRLPRPIRYITLSATKNGRKTWIAGPIPVIPGHVFVVKRKN